MVSVSVPEPIFVRLPLESTPPYVVLWRLLPTVSMRLPRDRLLVPARPPSVDACENVAVPAFPAARSSVEYCRALALATVRPPAASRVVPLNVLAAESVSVPVPSCVRFSSPVIGIP